MISLTAPRLSIKERAFFMRRLSFLIRSGMPVTDSLGLLETQSRSRSFKKALIAIRTDVENGRTLSLSFVAYPTLFNRFCVDMIGVGEASGTLDESLAYLSTELHKRSALRAKLVGALIYPAVITLATVALTVSLILFIFPKILPVFSGLGVELPWSTRAVLAVSTFLTHWGLVTLLMAIAVLLIAAGLYAHSIQMRRRVARTMLALPLIGTLLRMYHVANTTRTLSVLLASGMTLRHALPAAAHASGHILYREALQDLTGSVEEGAGLGKTLGLRRFLFPDVVGHMTAVGEASGTLARTLEEVAQFYEQELEECTKRLSSLIEPALMIAMGFIVGFVAISMIAPMYAITQHIHAS